MNDLQKLLAHQKNMLQENEQSMLSFSQGEQKTLYNPNNVNLLRQSQQRQQQAEMQAELHHAEMQQANAMMEAFAKANNQHSNMAPEDFEITEPKRGRDMFDFDLPIEKRQRVHEHEEQQQEQGQFDESFAENAATRDLLNKDLTMAEPAPVAASDEGIAFFNDEDVLSGRGGGTNVHPGNRTFRDLINLHRRSYLKARKNDKPAISRAIVAVIREQNGRFLKREDKSNLWFEIGDDAAREKTSQALRQRAPEMRKILFESERQQARQQVEEYQNTQSQSMYYSGQNIPIQPSYVPMQNKNQFDKFGSVPTSDYDQIRQNLMTQALLGGGINRVNAHGAWSKGNKNEHAGN